MMAGPIKLDFSEKYDDQHAQTYLQNIRTASAVDCPTGVTSNWRARRWRWSANLDWSSICPVVQGVSGHCWRKKPIG